MKINPMILLTLIAPIAHALPMQTITVTNTKEWATGNAKVHFTMTPGKMTKEERLGKNIAGNVQTNTTPQQAKVGGLSSVTSGSDISIYNGTDQLQIAKVFIYTCVSPLTIPSGNSVDDQCGNYFQSITLAPNSKYTQHFNPDLLVSFREAGDYTLESIASVAFSTDGTNPDHASYAKSDSTITVT